jgi:GxxExxY protein
MDIGLREKQLSELIIKAFYKVYNSLGYGFLEKVYEKALAIELRRMGLIAVCQQSIKVHYEGELVGEYFADVLVDHKIILELKTAEALAPEHEVQLINYLKATEIEIGYVLNFGPTPKFRRKIFTNDRKHLKNIFGEEP